MEAQRGKQFFVDHTLFTAIAYGIVISTVSVILTLALTGNIPDPRQTSATAAVGQTAGLDLDLPTSGSENFGNLDRLDQNPDMMVWKSTQAGANEALTDHQFLEQSTISAKSTAYGPEVERIRDPLTGLMITEPERGDGN